MNSDNKKDEYAKDHIDELLEEEEVVEESCCGGGGCECNGGGDEASELRIQLKESNDKLLRVLADFENTKRRLNKETDDKIKYANQSLLKGFLPILDNFDLALKYSDTVTVETVVEGVVLTQKSMLDTLAKSGLTKIDSKVGDPFDPEIHEAITLCNNPELPNNSIAMVIQNGYRLADRVIRACMVQVNKVS